MRVEERHAGAPRQAAYDAFALEEAVHTELTCSEMCGSAPLIGLPGFSAKRRFEEQVQFISDHVEFYSHDGSPPPMQGC